MNRRPPLLALLALAAVLFTAPRSFAAPFVLVEDETLKLPCGHTIKVLSVTKVEFSKDVPALMVRYQTPITVEESKALTQEVDDVWKIAVKDVERYGYREAIISSNEEPKGIFISANHTLNFLYEKGPDGKWTRLNRSDILAEQ
jgi:hypothetical protein